MKMLPKPYGWINVISAYGEVTGTREYVKYIAHNVMMNQEVS